MRTRIRDLTVVMVPASSLKPDPRNPRTHSPRQIRQIANSTKAFGWTNPIIVDADCHVLGDRGGLGGGLGAADFGRLMSGELAQMVFTDTPYNVPINRHVSGLGAVSHDEFAMATVEMTEAEFAAFLETVLAGLAAQRRRPFRMHGLAARLRAAHCPDGTRSLTGE
jgi:hypothetical protein